MEKVRLDDLSVSEEVLNETRRGSTVRREVGLGNANTPEDVAMLCLLMEQYELKGTDFPEIGDKTLISKILNGSRSLTKGHIKN